MAASLEATTTRPEVVFYLLKYSIIESMQLSDFDYNLPKELIANSHIEPRDHSRLLIFDRKSGQIEHKHFYDIVDYLNRGDVLVFNNSKVFKARIFGSKKTGGRIEFLVIRNIEKNDWEAMAKGKLKVGDKVFFEDKVAAEILEKKERTLIIRFNLLPGEVFKYLEKHGEMPLPPYVKVESQKLKVKSKQFYQNIYAENIGSVAAPTAGFHFTAELMDKLKKKEVEILYVTLHVGPGTFIPVEAENITEHKMHEEFFEVEAKSWNRIVAAKNNGRRVIAVGTTTCRTLESAFRDEKLVGSTDIFIYPSHDFKIVDSLITNFHLPKSTLLMLVSAFLSPKSKKGTTIAKKIYAEAIKKKYRFYSFGDSMFIK